MTFQWQKQYEVGEASIDEKHRDLFDLANQITHHLTHDELVNRIMLLYRHTREHFSDEEKLMKQQGYPDYDRHVADHDEMLAKLVAKSDDFRTGNISETQVAAFMEQWIAHITSGDRLFREFLIQKRKD